MACINKTVITLFRVSPALLIIHSYNVLFEVVRCSVKVFIFICILSKGDVTRQCGVTRAVAVAIVFIVHFEKLLGDVKSVLHLLFRGNSLRVFMLRCISVRKVMLQRNVV